MELKIAEQTLDKGEGLELKSFGMDTTIAMIALREKIYANPRRAAVQEYLSNARDANREAGRGTTPVEVDGPTADNPVLIFRDNGIGINPDRMTNVFTHYGKSTKRDSNSQTGGWGLGCKAGFAVSDQFTVVTRWEEEGKVLQASYVMLITPDQRSSFGQLGETEECDAGTLTGTEIHLPIDPDEVDEFYMHVESIAMYWGHPLVKNSATPIITWNPRDDRWGRAHASEAHSGNWILVSDEDANGRRRGEAGYIVIDGITYTLRMDALQRAGLTSTELEFMRRTISFYDTGEIMVTATREDIDYGSPRTVETLQGQVERMSESIRADLQKVLDNAHDYLQASRQVGTLRSRYGSLFGEFWKEARWKEGQNELMLFDFNSSMPGEPFGKYKVMHVTTNRHCDNGFNVAEVNQYRTPSYGDNIFVVCDVGRNRNNRIRGVLAKLPNEIRHGERRQRDSFYLIMPRGTQQKLVEPAKVFEEFGLGMMGFQPLSKFDEVRMARTTKKVAAHPERFARIGRYNSSRRYDMEWDRTEIDVTEGGGGIYVFYYREKGYYDKECTREVENMADLCKLAKRVYGISPKVADKIHPNWMHLDTYVEKLTARVKSKYQDMLGMFSVEWLSSMDTNVKDAYKEAHRKARYSDDPVKCVVEWPRYSISTATPLGKLVLMHEERIRLSDNTEYNHQYADHEYGYWKHRSMRKKQNAFNHHGHADKERIALHRRADTMRKVLHKFCQVTMDEAVESIRTDYPLLTHLAHTRTTVREVAAYIHGKDAIRQKMAAK